MVQNKTIKSKILSVAVRCGILLVILLISNVSLSSAQQSYFWSGQEKIPEYNDDTEEPPFLITDQNHTVHAFNSQSLNLADPLSPKAIFYREWNVENGWTFPNDILYSAGSSMDLIGVTADQAGKVHLIFQLHSDQVFYTWAFLADAENPAAWSSPQLLATESLGTRPGIANTASIATDASGDNIVVIYSGLQEGSGLYFTYSNDQGSTWSQPYPIYLTGDENIVVTDPKLYAGKSGIFHAVWTTFLSSGAGGSGYYANFEPSQGVWSEPEELDIPGIRTPSVIEYGADVIVSYHHYNVNGNWWKRSSDNGKTWTYPAQISPRHVGTNGAVSFVVDSSDTLHAFFGERIDDNNHGMWHSVLVNNIWTNPEAVVRGPQVRDVVGGKGFDPRSARAVISNGNVVLVTWGTDGAGGLNGAWYSYKQINTAELPAQPLLIPTVMVQSVSTDSVPVVAAPSPEVESVPTSVLSSNDDSPQSSRSPQSSILLGVIPVFLVLIGIILIRNISYSRNK
jgi:hypothetical protein